MYEFSPFGANFLPRLIPSSGKTYDFRDEFKTALAAASVNATSCEPGPGTRTVTDSEGKLSIANGKLTFAGGKASPAYGDPGYWRTGAITREAGKIVAFKVNFTTISTACQLGIDSNTSVTILDSFRVGSSGIDHYDNVVTPKIHTALSTATDYIFIMLLRSSGVYYFLKLPTGKIIYLFSNTRNNASTVYAGIANYNCVFTIDFIRIPRTKWLPTPLLSDSFAAADATSNDGRTSDGLGHLETTGLGSGGSGVVWSGASGEIQSNRLVITPTLGSELYANPGFEAPYSSGLANNWSKAGSPTLSEETTIIHGGSSAQKIAAVNSGNGVFRYVATTASSWYFLFVWAYHPTGDSGTLQVEHSYTNGGTIHKTETIPANSTWTKSVSSRRSTEQISLIYTKQYGATATIGYIDDASLKQITLSSCFATTTLTTTDIEITTKFQRTAGTQAGIVIGLNDAGTSFVLIYDDGGGYVKVDKCVAGTYTQLQNASMTYVADAELKVSRRTQSDGSSEVWAWYNNLLVGTAAAILSAGAENTALSGLKVGLFSTYDSNSFDICLAYDVGTGGSYNILDRLVGA